MSWRGLVDEDDDIELPSDDDDDDVGIGASANANANEEEGEEDSVAAGDLNRVDEARKMRAVYDSVRQRFDEFMVTNLDIFADLNKVVTQWYGMVADVALLVKSLSEDGCDDALDEVVDMVSKVMASLINLVVRRVGVLLSSTVRTMDGPGSIFLCVIILMTALDRILSEVDSDTLLRVDASRLPDASNPVSATEMEPILNSGVAVFDKPVSAYTMSELRTAISLMGDEWESIDLTNSRVNEYLVYLLSRACIIANVIQPLEVLDVPHWTITRILANEADDDTHLAIADMCFLRFCAAPVCKMLCVIDFTQSLTQERASVCPRALTSIRRRILRKYRELSAVDQTMKLIDGMCQKGRLRYSDVERFIDENPLCRVDAKIVLDTVHNGESQFSMFWFHRKVDGVSLLAEMDEQADAFPKHATLNQKLFVMNAKLFCFSAMLQHELRTRNQVDFQFLEKFCYDENDVIRTRQTIDNSEYPIIIIIQALPYVLSDGTLYDCRGMDVALIMWIDCVLASHSGIINTISYKDALSALRNSDNTADGGVRKPTNWESAGFVGYY